MNPEYSAKASSRGSVKETSTGFANLKVISATYGPHDGRRLLTGDLSTSYKARAPYERDVLPFVRSLLAQTNKVTNNTSDDEHDIKMNASGDAFTSSSSPRHTPSFVLSKTKNSITILDDVKSMNAIFGDPCPGRFVLYKSVHS